jgi:hypothetical protein
MCEPRFVSRQEGGQLIGRHQEINRGDNQQDNADEREDDLHEDPECAKM